MHRKRVMESSHQQEAGEYASAGNPVLFGYEMKQTRRNQFLLLVGGSLVSAIMFATLQEGVFQIEGFRFGGWMTLWTTTSYCLCGLTEIILTKDTVRKGKMSDYFILSVLTVTGMYLTNWALSYLNYATRVLFKSSKVLPTMIFGVIIQGRRYGAREYVCAVVLVLGITLFTMGDKDGMPSFHIFGVALITGGLCADAATSNFEEKRLFRINQPASQAEVLFYASLIGACYSLAMIVPTGEFTPALKHSIEHPQVVPMIMGFSVMGYSSVVFVLLLIKHYGATNCEIVKSMRKLLQVVLSFVVYPKPLSWKYFAGGGLCLVSLLWFQRLQSQSKAERHRQALAGAEIGRDHPTAGDPLLAAAQHNQVQQSEQLAAELSSRRGIPHVESFV